MVLQFVPVLDSTCVSCVGVGVEYCNPTSSHSGKEKLRFGLFQVHLEPSTEVPFTTVVDNASLCANGFILTVEVVHTDPL